MPPRDSPRGSPKHSSRSPPRDSPQKFSQRFPRGPPRGSPRGSPVTRFPHSFGHRIEPTKQPVSKWGRRVSRSANNSAPVWAPPRPRRIHRRGSRPPKPFPGPHQNPPRHTQAVRRAPLGLSRDPPRPPRPPSATHGRHRVAPRAPPPRTSQCQTGARCFKLDISCFKLEV